MFGNRSIDNIRISFLVGLCWQQVSAQTRSCPPGTFLNTSAGTNQCDPYSTCAAGSFVTFWGNATANRLCSPCVTGTFTNQPNQITCLPYNDCPAGTRIISGPTVSTGRVCEDCNTLLTYTALPNQLSCLPVRTCPPGTFVSGLPTRAVNRQCFPCSSETFSFADNTHRCNLALVCSPGTEYQTVAPTSSTDRHCTPATSQCTPSEIEVAPVTSTADRQCSENMCLRPGIFAFCPIDRPVCSYVSLFCAT